MKFFNRTAQLKELEILQHIENNPDCTQKELSALINATVSMIHKYIEALEEKAYLVREYASRKVVYYRITQSGIQRKNYLTISYTKELMDLYKLAKENVEIFVHHLVKKGYRRVLLYGAGEVAETILNVLRDMDEQLLTVIGIVDDDEKKKNQTMMGYPIIGPEKIKQYPADGIVVTTYAYEDMIMDRLGRNGFDMDKVERFFG